MLCGLERELRMEAREIMLRTERTRDSGEMCEINAQREGMLTAMSEKPVSNMENHAACVSPTIGHSESIPNQRGGRCSLTLNVWRGSRDSVLLSVYTI